MAGELGNRRAKRMLKDLSDAPFVALVFSPDEIRIYAKGLDADKLRMIEELAEDITEDEEQSDGT